MKIIIITQKFLQGKMTGAEKFAYNLAINLVKKGHEVIVLTDKENAHKKIKCEKILFGKNKIIRKLLLDYFNPFFKLSINKILKKYNPDIIHIHNFYGMGIYQINRLSMRFPIIITLHDFFICCYKATMSVNGKLCNKKCNNCYFFLGNIHRFLIQKFFNNIKLISPSKALLKEVKQLMPQNNINLLRYGIDFPRYSTKYRKYILFVGRLCYEKGLQTIIEVLNKINDYKILILGEGYLKQVLEEKYKNVKFLGFINPQKYYKIASILIAPSIYMDNFPNSILEAMSYGICVIASNIGGISEQITHNKTGLLFRPNDKKDFEKKLNFLLKNENEIRRMGKNARKFVKEKFSWDIIIKKYEKIYKQTIKDFKKNDK